MDPEWPPVVQDVPAALARSYLDLAKADSWYLAGRLAEARAGAEGGYRQALQAGDAGLTALWAACRGAVAQLYGDLALAVDCLREAVALAEHHDPHGMRDVHLAALAGALAMTGQLREAQRHLRRVGIVTGAVSAEVADGDAVAEMGDAGNVPTRPLLAARVLTSRGWVASAGHDRPGAVELAIRAGAIARRHDMPALEAHVLYDAVRHGGARRVCARLSELVDRVDGPLVQVYADCAVAHCMADGPRLEEVAASLADLRLPLMAAEAMAEAHRAYRRVPAAGRPPRLDRTERCRQDHGHQPLDRRTQAQCGTDRARRQRHHRSAGSHPGAARAVADVPDQPALSRLDAARNRGPRGLRTAWPWRRLVAADGYARRRQPGDCRERSGGFTCST